MLDLHVNVCTCGLQAKQELPNMQGALERTHDNQYHLYNVEGFANTITEGAKVTQSSPASALQCACASIQST